MTPVLQTAVGLAIPFVARRWGAAAVFFNQYSAPGAKATDFVGFVRRVMLGGTWFGRCCCLLFELSAQLAAGCTRLFLAGIGFFWDWISHLPGCCI